MLNFIFLYYIWSAVSNLIPAELEYILQAYNDFE